MKSIKIDRSNQNKISFTDGLLDIVYDDAQIEQLVHQVLGVFKGEYFLNLDKGIPYLDEVFVKNPKWNIVEANIKKTILAIPEIISFETFTITTNYRNRTATLDFKCNTIYNTTISFNEVL
jgi:hypothetical protein